MSQPPRESPAVPGDDLPKMMEVVGSTGLRAYGGFVAEEFLPELRGHAGARIYREMTDNDATAGAIVFVITALLRQAKWDVQAANDTPEGEDGKQFLKECLDDMDVSWVAVIAEIASMFVYGYAPMEVTYKRRSGPKGDAPSRFADGRVGIRSIGLRAQTSVSRWEIEEHTGRILGLWQRSVAGPLAFIPAAKLLLFRTTEERNNPEGRSILRSGYRAWYFKKRIEEIEAVGIERDLAGLPVIEAPARLFAQDADASEKALLSSLQALVTGIRRDQREGVVMPVHHDASGNRLFDLKLLATGGSRTFDTSRIIDRYSRAIATAALADFLFLGQQSVGSFAMFADKTALFATALGAFADGIAGVFNRQMIPLLWELNGWGEEVLPKIVCRDLEKPNLTEMAAFLSALAGAGMPLFPDRELENALRDMAGLPAAPEDGGLDHDPSAGAVPGMTGGTAPWR